MLGEENVATKCTYDSRSPRASSSSNAEVRINRHCYMTSMANVYFLIIGDWADSTLCKSRRLRNEYGIGFVLLFILYVGFHLSKRAWSRG